MRRKSQARVLAVGLCLFMFGCVSAVRVPTGTFVNESDRTQLLELTPDVSQTPNVWIRLSIETGANKFFGKTVGIYTLRIPRGTTTGKFVSFKPLGSAVQAVALRPEQGKEWSLTGQPDGSFRDSTGAVWRLQ